MIPKSSHIERMRENLQVLDFVLCAEDMERIAALDTGKSAFFAHTDPEMVVKMVEERKHIQG